MLPLSWSMRVSALSKLYRVYWFDMGRKTVSVDFVKAASDDDAITRTREAGFGAKCEIFDGKRLVAQLENEARRA